MEAKVLKLIGLLCLIPVAAPLAAIAAFRRLWRVEVSPVTRDVPPLER